MSRVKKRRTPRTTRARGAASMPCPECGETTEVLRTRRVEEGTVRRQRRCKECDHRFFTYEGAIPDPNAEEELHARQRRRAGAKDAAA